MLDSRLLYVVAVSRAGSFTAAAEAAGVTQSAITKSVADLEQQIGYSIFYRTARGALLTEEGRDFVERAARLLEDAGELMRRNQDGNDIYAGTLRIGVCPASLEWRLVEPLARLLQRHPSIRFDVSGSTFERMVQLLRTGSVDVALGMDAAFAEWSDIRREPVPAVTSKFFVRKGHPLLRRGAASIKELAKYDFVSPSEGRPYGAVIRQLYEKEGIDWRHHVHSVDYFPIARRIVGTTDTIGLVSEPYSQSNSFRESFRTLENIDIPLQSPMCCAVRSRWEPKPAVRAFIAAVREGTVKGRI